MAFSRVHSFIQFSLNFFDKTVSSSNVFVHHQAKDHTYHTSRFSAFTKFRGYIEIPRKGANFAVRLEILWPVENWALLMCNAIRLCGVSIIRMFSNPKVL